MLFHHDYTERVVDKLSQQIKSGYYGGNRSVSIEGVNFEHFSATDQEISSSSLHSFTNHYVFHLFVSDSRKQDAATIDSRRKRIIDILKIK